MIEKLLKKYKRKNELHAPITAHCACSLKTLNQNKLNNAIKKPIKDLVHRADRAANWCAVV